MAAVSLLSNTIRQPYWTNMVGVTSCENALLVKALANEDTLLPTQILCLGHKKCLILFRNILCPQQMFPSLRSMETQHSFCAPRVCTPKKHHGQQCVRFCQYLNVSNALSTSILPIESGHLFLILHSDQPRLQQE